MTLTTTTVKTTYNGDGSTIVFPVGFTYWDADDIRVILTDTDGADTEWTRGTQFELPDGDGGTDDVTVNITPIDYTPQAGEKLTILSDLPDTQETSIPLGGAFPSTAIEQRLDQITRLLQQRSEELDRVMKFGVAEAAASIGDFPSVSSRLSKFLGFDAAGVPIAAAGTSADLTPVSAFIDTLLDDTNALTSKQTLKTLFNDINSQTGSYAAVISDDGKLILFTGAGGYTFDLLATATAGNGFVIAVQNSSSSTVTIDPNGAELINGAATLVLQANESAILYSTGTAWRALIFSTVRTSTTVSMLSKPIEFAEGAAVASAGTTDIWGGDDGNTVHVTGTTTITSLGTAPQAGAYRRIIFDGALLLTHGANLNLPGAANITTAAGDSCLVYADTTTQLDVVQYQKASGEPILSTNVEVFTASGTFTAKRSGQHAIFIAGGGAGGGSGGGGGGGVGAGGGGGGGSGAFRIVHQSLTKGTGYTVTVGAGGAGGAGVALGVNGNNGTAGGQSVFDAATAGGGGAGAGGQRGNDGGAAGAGGTNGGGTATGGTSGLGNSGGDVTAIMSTAGAAGGSNNSSTSGGGGGAGGASFNGLGSNGATGSSTGVAGLAASNATNLSSGGGGGGGGGTDASGGAGGDGADGLVVVFW